MHKEHIEFKKERDLGSIITDAFKFIRLEGKPFFMTILNITAVPILITVIAAMFLGYSFSNIESVNPLDGVSMGVSGLIMALSYIVTIVYINLAGMYYIKSYIDNKGIINRDEIKENTKRKFWSFTGFGIIAALIFMISVLLCVFPIFYSWTVLSLGASILVFQNETATGAIGKCFSFINGHFLETFGVIFVVSLLVGVLGYVFQIPATIYQFIKMGIFSGSQDPTEVFNLFKDPIYLFLYFISIVGQLMFYAITLITNVFLYFDINEQKNLTGTLEKIDGLGQ